MNKTSKASQHTKVPVIFEVLQFKPIPIDTVGLPNNCVLIGIPDKAYGHEIVALVYGDTNDKNVMENARLIAAAPNLLNLCKDAKDLIYRCPSLRQAPEVEQFLNALLQAIAKTEGSENE